MPVEIRELVIRAVVAEEPSQETTTGEQLQRDSEAKDELVQECVKQVLKILQKKKDR